MEKATDSKNSVYISYPKQVNFHYKSIVAVELL